METFIISIVVISNIITGKLFYELGKCDGRIEVYKKELEYLDQKLR